MQGRHFRRSWVHTGALSTVERPPSKRAIRDAANKAKKDSKQALKYTADSCTWSRSQIGGRRANNRPRFCCETYKCTKQFANALGREELCILVLQMRRHYYELDEAQQREWWGARVEYTGYQEGQRLSAHSRLNRYYCETPTEFQRRLTMVSTTILPPLLESQTTWCCQRWLLFISGGHADRFFDSRLRLAAHAKEDAEGNFVGPAAEDFDCRIPAKRDTCWQTNRASEKKANVLAFLLAQAELAEHLPNEKATILPFRTVMHTHYFMVCQAERTAGCDWALSNDAILDRLRDTHKKHPTLEKRLQACVGYGEFVGLIAPPDEAERARRRAAAVDSEEDMCSDEDKSEEHVALEGTDLDEEEEEATKAWELSRKKYRYGNRLCGEKGPDADPEQEDIVGYKYFCGVWWNTPDVRNILCREHLPFAKCSLCVRGRDLSVLGRSKEERKEATDQFVHHLKEVYGEKLSYYSNRIRTRMEPKRFLSLIVDGSDQSKSTLPHSCEASHLSEVTENLKTHVYGCLSHGRRAYAFIVGDHVKQGHNTTIQVVHAVLVDTLRREGTLPKTMFLQLDNTSRQNKGQYLFAYLALLVHLGWFEYIYVNFLPKGHTHEDIDQMFSRFCMGLRFSDAFSQEDLAAIVGGSFHFENERPTVERWDTIANMSGYLAHYTNDFADGCMQFRHFRFFRSASDSQVWMQSASKMSSAEDPVDVWRGLKPHQTHNLPFGPASGYGVPDLWGTFSRNKLPVAEKREVPSATLNDWEKAIEHFHDLVPSFTDDHRDSCVTQIQKFRDAPATWPWSREDMALLYQPSNLHQRANLSAPTHFAIKSLIKDAFYLCRAGAGHAAPFFLCRVKAIATENNVPGARVQWFQLEEDQDPYDGTYAPELKNSSTRRYTNSRPLGIPNSM